MLKLSSCSLTMSSRENLQLLGSSVVDGCSDSLIKQRSTRSLCNSFPRRAIEDCRFRKHDRWSPTNFKSTPSTKRMVSFHDKVSVRLAMHRNDYKEGELSAVWYSEEENVSMNLEAKKLVKKLNRGENMSQEDLLSVRGLECRTQCEDMRKSEIRELSRTLVRHEQERQWKSGDQYSERMAALLYFNISRQAKIEARQRGHLDELAAHTIQEFGLADTEKRKKKA